MDFTIPDEVKDIREAVRGLCSAFPGSYWRELEPDPDDVPRLPELYRDIPEFRPAEHAGGIQQDQLTHLGVAGDLEPGVDRGADRVRRRHGSRSGHHGGHPRHHIPLDGLHHLAE